MHTQILWYIFIIHSLLCIEKKTRNINILSCLLTVEENQLSWLVSMLILVSALQKMDMNSICKLLISCGSSFTTPFAFVYSSFSKLNLQCQLYCKYQNRRLNFFKSYTMYTTSLFIVYLYEMMLYCVSFCWCIMLVSLIRMIWILFMNESSQGWLDIQVANTLRLIYTKQKKNLNLKAFL